MKANLIQSNDGKCENFRYRHMDKWSWFHKDFMGVLKTLEERKKKIVQRDNYFSFSLQSSDVHQYKLFKSFNTKNCSVETMENYSTPKFIIPIKGNHPGLNNQGDYLHHRKELSSHSFVLQKFLATPPR